MREQREERGKGGMRNGRSEKREEREQGGVRKWMREKNEERGTGGERQGKRGKREVREKGGERKGRREEREEREKGGEKKGRREKMEEREKEGERKGEIFVKKSNQNLRWTTRRPAPEVGHWMASASALAVPSWPTSLAVYCGGDASVGSRFSRVSARS